MENKKLEKKSVLKKLTIGIAAMALISCAFVGGTFARYESDGVVDNGGANVADWYIDVMNGSGVATASLTISPDDTVYGSTDRTHTANSGGTVLTFVNRGEVSAHITVTIEEDLVFSYKKAVKTPILDANKQETGEYEFGWEEGVLETGTTYTDSDGNAYTWDATKVKPVFANNNDLNALWNDVKLGGDSGATGNVILKVGDMSVTGVTAEADGSFKFTLAPGETATVTMSAVTWTSDFTTASEDGTQGDARDTWIGENIAEVGYEITWSAEQSSEQPE